MSRFPDSGIKTFAADQTGYDPASYRESDPRFGTFRDLLLLENLRYNLTALKTPEAVDRRLIDDSLRLAPLIESLRQGPFDQKAVSLIDIGSGAGIPSIPLAIAFPDITFTAVEATGKKADFIERAAHSLDLTNMAVVHARSEDLAHEPSYRGQYTFATARAVGSLATLLELVLPFLEVGGIAIFPKGVEIATEYAIAQRVAERIGGRLRQPHSLAPAEGLPATTIVFADKLEVTPGNYPRRAGIPAKHPLTG